MEPGDATKVTVYVGDSFRYRRKKLYHVIVDALQLAETVRSLMRKTWLRYTNHYTNADRNRLHTSTCNCAQDLPHFLYLC